MSNSSIHAKLTGALRPKIRQALMDRGAYSSNAVVAQLGCSLNDVSGWFQAGNWSLTQCAWLIDGFGLPIEIVAEVIEPGQKLTGVITGSVCPVENVIAGNEHMTGRPMTIEEQGALQARDFAQAMADYREANARESKIDVRYDDDDFVPNPVVRPDEDWEAVVSEGNGDFDIDSDIGAPIDMIDAGVGPVPGEPVNRGSF